VSGYIIILIHSWQMTLLATSEKIALRASAILNLHESTLIL
jgi:hypothetical protein